MLIKANKSLERGAAYFSVPKFTIPNEPVGLPLEVQLRNGRNSPISELEIPNPKRIIATDFLRGCKSPPSFYCRRLDDGEETSVPAR